VPYVTDYDIDIIEADLPGIVSPVVNVSGTWILTTNTSFLSISANGILKGTPRNKDVGIYFVNISIIAIEGIRITKYTNFTLTVHNTNDVPYITSTPPLSAIEEVLYTYSVVAGDDDLNISVGENLIYSLDSAPEGMSINSASGLIQWIPTNNQSWQDHTIVVKVTDVANTFATQQFTINVTNTNDVPYITSSPPNTATEDVIYTYSVEAEDDDLNISVGEILTYSLDKAPKGMSINSATGLIQWVPTNDQACQNHIVIVNVTDIAGTFATQQFTINVTNTNDVPYIKSTPPKTASEDVIYTYSVEAEDDDLNISAGEILTYSLDLAPKGMSINSASGLIQWVPMNRQACQDHIVIVNVSDIGGIFDTQEYTINVSNTNDDPVITSTFIPSAVEDELYEYQITATDDDFMNPSYELLTFSLDHAPKGMTIESDSGLTQWQPTNDDVGEAKFVVNVSDVAGAFSTKEFTITVSNTNDAPEINHTIGKITIDEDTVYRSLDLTSVFTDIDKDSILIFRCEGQENIRVTIFQNNGRVILYPNENWNGEETLTFYANDSVYEIFDQAKITVTPINDPPGPAKIIIPIDGTETNDGETINLEGTCDDPDMTNEDGDLLTFEWYSNIIGMLGEGEILNNILLPIGNHIIKLEVTDLAGENTVVTTHVFVIETPHSDTDSDGMPNIWEREHRLDPEDPKDTNKDPDNDGLVNFDEYKEETNPQEPDSDKDGLSDGDEIKNYQTNATNPDTDGDGYNDGEDEYPLDNTKWEKNISESDENNSNIIIMAIVIIILLIILIFLLFIFLRKEKPSSREKDK
jgi:hypothetical protein